MERVTEKKKKSKHFNGDSRYLLQCYKQGAKGFPKVTNTQCLADIFGCSRRTIQREIKRGEVEHTRSDLSTIWEYNADYAQNDADRKKETKGAPLKIGSDHALEEAIIRQVKDERRSPYAAIQAFRNGGWPGEARICERTLYNYINSGLFAELSRASLPNKGRNFKKKASRPRYSRAICALKSIDTRPAEADSRDEVGHWEMDTVKGPSGGSPACLLTLTERKHRKEIIRLMADGTSESLVAELDRIQADNPLLDFSKVFRTLTGDCGSENLDAHGIEKECRTRMFYAHPYHSWERGTNENHNRMIRRFFPKGTDFSKVTREDVSKVQDWMNSCPRKILGGLTPDMSFSLDVPLHIRV